MEIKNIPLHSVHEKLGAKIIPFAGYNMPVRYSTDMDEHYAVRQSVGIFDVSHMGEFMVSGKGALDLLQWVTSNDVSKLVDGKVQYSCFPNQDGGIIDDLLVYKLADDTYFLVVNASNIEKDWAWISKNNTFNAELKDMSADLCLFAIQGPKAILVLQKLTTVDLSSIPYYAFEIGTLAGVENIIISNTGYTGAGGFEVYIPNVYAENVWDKIMKAGEEFGIKPIGLGARDTLRLEKGFCLYGNDIDDNTSPLEAGLGWITKFSKKFINSEKLEIQKNTGVNRKLIGFKMIDRGIPRGHYEICDMEGIKIGEVTSGTQSPTLGFGIGMGYVAINFSKPETYIYIRIREKLIKAEVVKLPFL